MVSVQKMAQELAEETVEANETEKGACRSQYLQQSLTAMFCGDVLEGEKC